jgi:hypothetical protein
MTNLPQDIHLPTLDWLGATVADDADPIEIARTWFKSFGDAVSAQDTQRIVSLLLPDSFWRDVLTFTWNYRTFRGVDKIKQFLDDRISIASPSAFALDEQWTTLERPYPDIVWVQGVFKFETGLTTNSGVFRLVPTADGAWKAHTIFTAVEALHGVKEPRGSLRDLRPHHGHWLENRQREIECVDKPPRVIVIGAGTLNFRVISKHYNCNF